MFWNAKEVTSDKIHCCWRTWGKLDCAQDTLKQEIRKKFLTARVLW